MAGMGGVWKKPPDWCAVLACSYCHDVLDGRQNPDAAWLGAAEGNLDRWVHEAHIRTLKRWEELGHLVIRA